MESRLRGSAGVWLAVIAAAMLVLSGLFASAARAQTTPPDSVVVDLVVETNSGECGEGDCADNERPVNFDVVAEVNAGQNVPLTESQQNEINAALAAADFGITVENPNGGTQDIEDGETVCLEPGEYTATATLSQAEEEALVAEIVEAVNDSDVTEQDIFINFDETTFVVEECDGDDNGGNVNIDDRDQTNVCNQVVNIINEDVQNPDVDNTQDADGNVNNPPEEPIEEPLVEEPEAGDDLSDEQLAEVTDEQIVDIAQELNVSPVIVQTCIQQNAGRDANINSNNAEENIAEENIAEEFDDGLVAEDQYGGAGVVAESIPDKLLPNTGGISPATVLAALGFTLLLAGLSAGYAVARRGS